MAGKLTEEQEQEIVRRYQKGDSQRTLAKEYRRSSPTIRDVIERSDVECRCMSEALLVAHGKEVFRPSDAAIKEAYWGPKSGYPSCNTLAKRWGVDHSTAGRWIKQAGCKLRTLKDQIKVEYSAGRLNPIKGHVEGWNRFAPGSRPETVGRAGTRLGQANSRRHNARISEARKNGTWYPCNWCADQIWRSPSQLKNQWPCCSVECVRQRRRFVTLNHESSPRPLILARLREILQEQWFRALPRTLETLEKAGEPIGAQEAEINAVWQEIQPEADLLARVINAPPMAAGGGQPKEPRKKPALTPEQVGPLGEALLRAQREQAK